MIAPIFALAAVASATEGVTTSYSKTVATQFIRITVTQQDDAVATAFDNSTAPINNSTAPINSTAPVHNSTAPAPVHNSSAPVHNGSAPLTNSTVGSTPGTGNSTSITNSTTPSPQKNAAVFAAPHYAAAAVAGAVAFLL